MSPYKSISIGQVGQSHFKTFLHRNDMIISPWHDVPLYCSGSSEPRLVNFVCEVPAHTRAKLEMQTGVAMNPIMQDRTKEGALRSYTYGEMPVNYGALPQTWEDPNARCRYTGFFGDDDPLDVMEIGTGALPSGRVVPVKLVTALAMIDGGKTDWKLIGIRASDHRFDLINRAEDVEAHFPSLLDRLREWLRMYKTYEGGTENTFALGERYQPLSVVNDVLETCHSSWASRLKHPSRL